MDGRRGPQTGHHSLQSTLVHLYSVHDNLQSLFFNVFHCMKKWKELLIFTNSQHCHFRFICNERKHAAQYKVNQTLFCTFVQYVLDMYWMFSNIVSSPYIHNTMLHMGPVHLKIQTKYELQKTPRLHSIAQTCSIRSLILDTVDACNKSDYFLFLS